MFDYYFIYETICISILILNLVLIFLFSKLHLNWFKSCSFEKFFYVGCLIIAIQIIIFYRIFIIYNYFLNASLKYNCKLESLAKISFEPNYVFSNLTLDGVSILFILLFTFLLPICTLTSWSVRKYKTRYFYCLVFIEVFLILIFST
jgi:NADH:ubiquinone oxidoreductase subunit 4 (subunit M)